MTAATIHDRTVGGTMIYLDYLTTRGYASTGQIDPWKTAIRKVFETVDSESWEAADWSKVDLDDYLRRFRVLAGEKYRSESIVAYGRRVRNAFEAHEHYIETGRPPSFRQRSASKPKAEAGTTGEQATTTRAQPERVGKAELQTTTLTSLPAPESGFELDFPLDGGGTFLMRGPKRLSKRDSERIIGIVRTLEEQPQLTTGSLAA